MFYRDDDSHDSPRRVAAVAIALGMALAFGLHLSRSLGSAPPDLLAQPAPAAPAAAPAPVAVATASAAAPSPVVEFVVVKFYFDTGRAQLTAGADAALADALQAVAVGKALQVSGFHDATGNAAQNAALAEQRAQTVRKALLARGVAAERVSIKKPEHTLADGQAHEARRVEVVAQ